MNTNDIASTNEFKREDFFTLEKKRGVAIIWLDRKGEAQNVIAPSLIGFFDGIFEEIDNDNSIYAIIMASKKKDFIAGADIKSFKAEQPGDFQPISRKGHAIMQRIEKSRKPVVAAIHGTCYGLGVELSLACAARVATDHKSTKLALPEVKLGLLPGGGGTQRLPRLIGVQNALDMMLTGKNIFARKAKKIGLVDQVVNQHKLEQAAIEMALKLVYKPLKRPKSLLDRALGTSIAVKFITNQARKMSYKQARGNYPAIPAIIDCVEIGLTQGEEAGYQAEVEKFEQLILSNESKALISIFFNMTDKKKAPKPDLVRPIQTIAMLGAGFMGAGITEVSIKKSYDVILKDIKDDMLSSARKTIWKNLAKSIKRKIITPLEAEKTMQKIQGQLNYNNFDQVDLVVEAVLEKMDLKKAIIKEVEALTKEDCIFATNTSALSISEMATVSKRPEQLIGMHYFSPVPKMPLLEIVVTDQTADWVINTCFAVGVKQGKTCIVVKDSPGFYVNRILAPYLNECMLMIEEGADIAEVDKLLTDKGFPVGPMQLMDEVGIDVGAHIMTGDLMKSVEQRDGITISEGLPKMFAAGYYGRKNKKGYYYYDAKNKRGKVNTDVYQFFGGGERQSLPSSDITNRPIMLMLNEALMCLEEGIISSAIDGDIGAVFGIGFLPFTGGPFKWIDTLGADKVVANMEGLAKRFGPKFKPAAILYQQAKNGTKFHPEQ